ncbi:MAG: AI-2E family transporter [Bacteroidetes bacterium]|nr:AI-2E family transporter [Bacteroidota bacterium]
METNRPHQVEPSAAQNGEPPQRALHDVVFQGLVVLGGLAAFVFLLLVEGAALGPLVVAAAGLILLWPLRAHKAIRALLLAGGFVLAIWALRRLGGVLTPFAIVFLLAYLLNPLVTGAHERFRVKRWITSLVLTLAFIGVLVLFVLLIVPSLVGQIESLATAIIGLVSGLPQWVAEAEILNSLEAAGLIEREALTQQLATFLPSQISAIAAGIPSAVASLTRSVGALFALLTTIALIPVLLFYILKDYVEIREAIVGVFPRFKGGRAYLTHTSKVVGNYLRGQITISTLGAIIVTIPLVLFGVPFALVIGLLTGLLNMIPNLGAILTYIIGGLLMLAFGSVGDFFVVMIVLVGQSVLEQSVLTPNIMSQSVGLHPVLIIFSLFVFSAFFGFLGLLIAVPVTALLVQVYKAYREDFVIDIEAQPDLIVAVEE